VRDVILLSNEDHTTLHRFIEYDQDHLCYRTKLTGELLDTREKHVGFMGEVLQIMPF